MSRDGLPQVGLPAIRSIKQSVLELVLLAIGAEIVGVCVIWAAFGSWKRRDLAECAAWGSIPCAVVLLVSLWLRRKIPVPPTRGSLDYHRHNLGLVIVGGLAAFILMAIVAVLAFLVFGVWFELSGGADLLRWDGAG